MLYIKKKIFSKKFKKRSALNFKLKFTYKKNNFFLNFIFNNHLIKRRSYGFIVDSRYYLNVLSFIIYIYNKKKKKKDLNFWIFELNGLITSRVRFFKKSISDFLKDIFYKSGYLTLQNTDFWSFNGCRLKSKIRKTRHKRKNYMYNWRSYFYNLFV